LVSVRLLLAVLLLGGCASAPARPAAPYTAEDSVYAALIEHYVAGNAAQRFAVLIPDSTTGLRWPEDFPFGARLFERFIATLPDDLLASFEAALPQRAAMHPDIVRRFWPRVRSYRFTRGPGPPEGYYRERDGREVPLRLDEDETYTLADGTSAVTHVFSRVGFDAERRRALLYDSGQCGPRCGGDGLVLLERDAEGRWRYARRGGGAIY
jgi:hypothetical protein